MATLPRVERVELLPFHKLGAHKYEKLGRPDPLADTPPMEAALCNQLQQTWFSQWNTRFHAKKGDAV